MFMACAVVGHLLMHGFWYLEFLQPSAYLTITYMCTPELVGYKHTAAVIGTLAATALGTTDMDPVTLHRLFAHTAGILLTFAMMERTTVEYKRVCAALHKACEAEARFISVCSHELRTPLNAILSYSAFLAEDMVSDEDCKTPRRQEDLRGLQAAAESLHQIVENVLAFSTNPSQLRLESLNHLNPAVDNIFTLARQRRSPTDTEPPDFCFDWTNPSDTEELFLPMDRFRLVVLNLVMNARKFTPAKSRVTVACSVIQDPIKSTRYIETSVTDEGPGVSVRDARRVFTPFVRLANSTGVEGVGLGLSICQASVERSGGTIRIDDAYKGGARFVFTLPLVDAGGREAAANGVPDTKSVSLASVDGDHDGDGATSPRPSSSPSSSTSTTSPLRCLVVDDVPVNRKLLRRHLERCGVPVVVEEADGPVDVLTHPTITSFHLIFLDIYMPVMSGVELVSILRSRHPTDLGSVVATSASKFDTSELHKAGFDTCVPKPIQRSCLEQLLTQVAGDSKLD